MATETILSPGVFLQEVDRSFIQTPTDPSGLAIVGPTVKGPVETPTVVRNYQEFKNIFGTTEESASQAYVYYTSVAAKNYFQNGGSSALITRVVTSSADWAAATSSRITPNDGGAGGDGPFTLETLGKGTVFNSEGPHNTNGSLASGSKDNIRWEIKNINEAQGTFTLIIRRGDDTTAKPIILEQFTECSLDPLSPNYISRKVGDQYQTLDNNDSENPLIVTNGEFPNMSQYVRVSAVSSSLYEYIGTDGVVQAGYANALPGTGSGSFGEGAGSNMDGNPLYGKNGVSAERIQGLVPESYTDVLNLLKNKEEYKFKTLVVPGLTQEHHASTIDTIIQNVTGRGDCFYVVDLHDYGATTANVIGEAADIDSSFAAAYWPWVLVRSAELNKNVWCPASTVIPGVYSKNDSIAAPWFAPAGLTRGGITNVVRVEKKLPKATRDTLYSNKVNPLATFPGQGIVVFGQKTLQAAKSALDRVNVRRMLLDVKETISGFADSVLFEQNTEATRQSFLQQANPYLESLIQRQGLYAFRVVMDDSNNTPDVIDNNQLVGQVFLQPTKTAEFIIIDFTLTPTGASFTD